MREDNWQFSPTHKVFMGTNHKPSVRGTDHGIWRRIKVVPFTVAMSDSRPTRRSPSGSGTRALESSRGSSRGL